MNRIDLNGMYRLMTLNYGCRDMRVITLFERENFLTPRDICVEFIIDPQMAIDTKRLSRRLKRFVKPVNDYFVIRKPHKILVVVELYREIGKREYDFDFSEN